MDPGTATLGALALLEPLLKACWEAYGVYSEAQAFGRDYRTALRKLDAQRAILKGMADLKLHDLEEEPTEGSDMLTQIRTELAAMKDNFEICQKLIKKLASWERPPESSTGTSVSGSGPLGPASTTASSSQSSQRRGLTFNPKTWHLKRSSKNGPGLLGSTPSNTSSSSVPTCVEDLSVLRSPAIEEQARQEHAEEARVQQAVNFYHTAHWALSEHKTFETAIEELDNSNRTIYKLLRIRALADPGFFLPDPKIDKEARAELKEMRVALRRLHTALSSVNPVVKKNHVDISIQLSSEYSLTKDKVSELYGVELKDKSFALFLQVHELERPESHLLLVETPQAIPDVAEEESQIIRILKDKIVTTSDEYEETFKFIGHVPIPDLQPASIRLFQNIRTSFTTPRTLAVLLADQKYSDRSNAAWHVKIGLQVAVAYVQIVSIMKFPAAYPRPGNYWYYDPRGFPRPVMQNKPYLSWGVGSKAAPPDEFDIDITESLKVAPALELGLLLYQIGAWKTLAYVDERGLTDLVSLGREARNSLQDVVCNSGMKYANIVQACLDIKNPEGGWEGFYQQILLSIRELDEEMQR